MEEINSTNNKARSKMKKTERRTFTVRNIEARQAEDGTMRMAGYAAVFNEPSLPLPFIEKIAPGAFTKTLQETPDVRLLINHEGLPMARTKNGTMRLYEDATGLFFEAELADTQEARDLYTLVARGDVDQMSFAFRVIRQNWSKDRSERTLAEVSLADGDVSIVTYPAYPATSVEAREAIKRAALALKEGREMSPETTVALLSILDKISDASDEIEEGKDLLQLMLGLPDDDTDEDSPLLIQPTMMPESCDCCNMGCTCGDCIMCGGVEEMAATNVINVVDVPGQGGKIVGDFPSVLNFLPDNMPRSMSLRLAKAKRNNIK
jgi:HK97 family phage prohead protease